MTNRNLVAPWVRRFLLEHVVADLNLSRNTQASYRDALALFLPFAAKERRQPVDQLEVESLSPEVVRLFLAHLEETRRCSVSTRNQRLAAIHSFARFVGTRSPEHLSWCAEVAAIPFKRSTKGAVPYLDKPEMDALLPRPTGALAREYAITRYFSFSTTPARDAMRRLV